MARNDITKQHSKKTKKKLQKKYRMEIVNKSI